MPKKKAVAKSVKRAVKKAVKKSKGPVKTAKPKAAPRKAVKKAVVKAVKKAPAPPPPVAEPVKSDQPSLGRPLVTQEEKLYMLFHDDYQARQVFEFLRVVTVKELEEFSPQQIVHMMSKPLRMTVDRIRQRLAQYKRSLKDDSQFAADFRQQADKR